MLCSRFLCPLLFLTLLLGAPTVKAESDEPLSLLNLVHKFFGKTSPTPPAVHDDVIGRMEEVPDMETYMGQVDGGHVGHTTDMPTTTTINGTTAGPCGAHHFMCDIHKNDYETKGHLVCLPNKWRCDNVADCPDQSDEMLCASTSIVGCPSNHIVCNNGKCIPASDRCNGFDDCGDLTDEQDCGDTVGLETTTMAIKCDTNTHFQCHMGQCISMDAHCDGFQDCPGGDDEHGCPSDASKSCLSHQFKCHSTPTCIEQSWVCDGMHDCTDHSDELHCSNGEVVPSLDDYDIAETCTACVSFNLRPPHRTRVCSAEYQCASGTTVCVDRSAVCDGTPDCTDSSDEGTFCGDCDEHGCAQDCSPMCTCGRGHILAADGRNCEDVNECSTGVHGCEHECANTDGGFHCVCADGYTLSDDEKTCQLEDTRSGGLLVLQTHTMSMMPLFPGSSKSHEHLPLHTQGFVTSMAVRREMMSNQQHNHFVHLMNERRSTAAHLQHQSLDGEPDRNIVFFSTRSSAGLSGRVYVLSNREPICALDNVVGITSVAVDANTGNVYYAQASPANNPSIGVCDPSLRYCRTLLADSSLNRVRTLVVHNGFGRIYYAHTNADDHTSRISSMAMDGTDVRTLVEGKLEMPTALTMHEPSNTLYWVDADMMLIERVHVLTGRREVMFSHGIHNIVDMAAFNGRLIWIDRDTSSLVSASLVNVNDRKTLDVFPSPPQAMAIQHSAYIPITQQDSDPCVHLCLTRPTNATNRHGEWEMVLEGVCKCPNGYSWNHVLSACRPVGQPDRLLIEQQPYMCAEMTQARCTNDAMCFNGGVCDQEAVSAQVCICKTGYEGLYCEIDLYPLRTRSGGLLAICVLMVILILLAIVFFLYARRQRRMERDILPESLKKSTQPMIDHMRRRVEQVKERYGSVSAGGGLLGDANEKPQPSIVVTHMNVNAMERGGSFANPMYEENVIIVSANDKTPLIGAQTAINIDSTL